VEIEPTPEMSVELSNLRTVDSTQSNQVMSVRDLRDIPQHVSVTAAISR